MFTVHKYLATPRWPLSTPKYFSHSTRSSEDPVFQGAMGALMGTFVGDAAGATLEFPKPGVWVNLLRMFKRKGGSFGSRVDAVMVPFHFAFGNKAWAVERALTLCGKGVHGEFCLSSLLLPPLPFLPLPLPCPLPFRPSPSPFLSTFSVLVGMAPGQITDDGELTMW
jgi:hypothetical protein